MIRPRQIRLKLDKSTFQHCQQLSQESAHVWNTAKNFFWRTYRKKGIWLSESSLKRYVVGRFSLHSQSIQAIVEKFCDNLKTAVVYEVNYAKPYSPKRKQKHSLSLQKQELVLCSLRSVVYFVNHSIGKRALYKFLVAIFISPLVVAPVVAMERPSLPQERPSLPQGLGVNVSFSSFRVSLHSATPTVLS